MGAAAPLFSIAIPSYNTPGWTLEAACSACEQTFADREIIVIDDHSTVDYAEVEAFCRDAGIRYQRNTANLGRAATYRLGAWLATGRYHLNLDGDDLLVEPTYLEDVASALAAHPEVGAVVSDIYVEIDGRRERRRSATFERGVVDGRSWLDAWNRGTATMNHLGTVYRRELVFDHGFYEHDIIAIDWLGLRRMLLHEDVFYLPAAYACWRVHEQNFSSTTDPIVWARDCAEIVLPMRESHASHPGLRRSFRRALKRKVDKYVELAAGDRGWALRKVAVFFAELRRRGYARHVGPTAVRWRTWALLAARTLLGLRGLHAAVALRDSLTRRLPRTVRGEEPAPGAR